MRAKYEYAVADGITDANDLGSKGWVGFAVVSGSTKDYIYMRRKIS